MTAAHHPTHRTRRTSKMIKGSILGVVFAAASVTAMAAPASAIPDSDGGSTDVTVGVQPGITMTGLTSSFSLTGTPGATATNPGAVTFNVETNNVAGYAVTVQSQTETLDPTNVGNSDAIPIEDLKVREGTDAYQDVSAADAVTVHTQDHRSENGGDDFSNDYKIRIPVVNEDVYTATLDYVATSL